MQPSLDWSVHEFGEIVWEDFTREDHRTISAEDCEVLIPSSAPCDDKQKSQPDFGKYNCAADLNFHDWPDIDNCDVGRMFRYCDTIFEQNHVNFVDELSWLPSSSDVVDGPEASYPSDLLSSPKLGLLNDLLEENCADINDFPEYSLPITDVTSSSFGCCSGSLACRNDAEIESISVPKKQVEYQNPLEDETMQRWFDWKVPASAVSIQTYPFLSFTDEKQSKNSSICGTSQRWVDEKATPALTVTPRTSAEDDTMQRRIDLKVSTSAAPTRTYPFQCLPEENHFFGYPHNYDARAQVDYIPAEWIPQVQSTSLSNKYENEIHPMTSNKQFAPHAHQFLDHLKPSVPPVMLPDITTEKLLIKLPYAPLLMEHSHHNTRTNKPSILNKHIETRKGTSSGELDGIPITGIHSKVNQQNNLVTCVSSDGISVEAMSFQQLWHVMHQLDVGTKLLIRDSLYRLARSSRQRNIFTGRNCGSESMNTREILSAEALNKCRAADVETETNTIDRSIAHLLFQLP